MLTFIKLDQKIVNGRKKPGLTSFSVSLDPKKRRYSLLAKPKSIIKDNPAVMFAFADNNCSLALKLNDNKSHYFNSEDELSKILQKCLVTTRFIPHDLCLVVVAIWQ